MSEVVNVLFIEDSPGDARLVREELRSAGSKTTIRLDWVERLDRGLDRLESNHINAVLLDLNLPDSHGLNTLERVISYAPHVPVIVMTGQADEELAIKAVQAGAQDYLVKGQVDGRLLTRVIQYAIQRKQAEIQLAEALAFTEHILSSSPIGILTYKHTGECLSANDYAAQMVGGTREQLQLQNFHKLESWKQSGLYELAEKTISGGKLSASDIHLISTFSRETWLRAQFVTFKSAGEEILLLTMSDITERKQVEEALAAKNEELNAMSQQLWQAAKLATMGELAASIAHELNNPLATVSLRAEMLQAQFTPEDPQSKSLLIIADEVKRMSSLVMNLLQFSRRSSSQISTININEEVVNSLELVQYHLRKNNILTVQELSPEIPLVPADRQQLRQVFLNLFTNAADAMPLGGMLSIRTWSGEEPDAGITAPLQRSTTQSLGLPASDQPQVFIEVSDSGEGIAPEKLESVWEVFYTTKPEGKGTGLGLAICRRIIQEHGGTIEIFSDGISGKGTTVRVSLPAVNER